MARVGVVAIGRNEGERLRRCLQSLDPAARPTVYVDSGSIDGSVELARSFGADVVSLDLSILFTAARARNSGLERLLHIAPEIEYIQFVDGDCEVDSAWLPTATAVLDGDSSIVAVCGRRREQRPEKSVYNLLCDLEWDTPIGDALACGGDALMRVSSLKLAGGYRSDLIAGEEPELCVRLRENGGRIERIAAEMTRHNAAMTRFGQWWRRNVRAGHAFAEVSRIHAKSPFGIWRREVRSNWLWGVGVPVVAIALAPFTWGLSLMLFGGYLLLFLRIWQSRKRRGDAGRVARAYAFYCMLSKFPQAQGQIRYWRRRLFGSRQQLIEYKGAETSA